jgi:uncharacterized protein
VSVRERPFVLRNAAGERIRCDLRLPAGDGPFPVVVVLHGFKGFKDWGMFPPTARRLAERGIATVALNTSRNGVGENLTEFTELEAFARNTPGHEAGEVERVIDAITSGDLDVALDPHRLGLLGHSFGGGVVLLVASNDRRVKCVVTWASIRTFDRYTARAIADWRQRGRLDVPNLRTGQILWQDPEVLDDLEANREKYDLEAACRRLRVPLLCVHGEQDEAVDPASAGTLVDWAASAEKRVLRVPNTGHTFGAVHPWAGPTRAWEKAVDATEEWFRTHLG